MFNMQINSFLQNRIGKKTVLLKIGKNVFNKN